MRLSENQIIELNLAIDSALNILYENDHYLIRNKVHERSIVFWFSLYLHQTLALTDFVALNLDIEYNKNHSDPKNTMNFPNGTYPDMILHRRGSNDENILMIEFKTWWDNNTQTDIKKLKDFTDQNHPYKYGMGYSIVFTQERCEVQKTLAMNGEVCDE